MVDAKAEADDEKGFGDFTFASFHNLAVRNDQINGRKSTAGNDDDEWGDFVESPLRSELSNAQWPSKWSGPSKPFDPLAFFADHSTIPSQSTGSVPTRAESEKTQWVKLKGALPLSIFGGVEEEEEQQSGVADPQVGDANDSAGDIHTVNVRTRSNVSTGVTIFDAIANMYNQSQQIKSENGRNSNSNAPDLNVIEQISIPNAVTSNTDGLMSNSSGLSSNPHLFSGYNDNQSPQKKYVSGLSSNSDLFSWNNDSQSLQIKNASGLSSKSDLFAGSNDNQRSQIRNATGLSSNSDLFAGNNGNQSPQIMNVTVLSSNSDLFSRNNGNQSPQMEYVSGSSLQSDLFVGNNDSKSPRIKNGSGLSLNSDVFTGLNNGQSEQIKVDSGFNSYSSGLNMNADFFSVKVDFGAFGDPYSQKTKEAEISNGLHMNSNVSASTFSFMDLNFDGLISNSDLPSGNEFEVDDDGWEFKDAYSESKGGDANDKVAGKEQGNSHVTGFSSAFGNDSHEPTDLFAASDEFPAKPTAVDVGSDFKPLTHSQNGFSSESFLKIVQNGTEKGLDSDQAIPTVDSDESFGDFFGAFTGTGVKQEGDPQVNNLSYSEVEVLSSNSKSQGNETLLENHKGALPLSIFGDEELETDDSLNVQDAFTVRPFSGPRYGANSQGSIGSIHDLLSSLYGQAEQIPSSHNTVELTGTGLDGNSSDAGLSPSLVNSDNDFDDASWEFKDAPSLERAVDRTSLCSPEDENGKPSTQLKLNNHVDFYCELKDELTFVCKFHLDSLKKAQKAAALSGEDAKAEAIENEIQEARKELLKENINCEEYLEDQPPRDIFLNGFLEVLQEVKFQVLESEYHLSTRLHLAEKDLRSAIKLMKHTTSTLNVLTLGSSEDQDIYVSTWLKLISVCTLELKHGSLIWKQLLEKNLQTWILSESRGKHFILALGEIYRVVVILGASMKLYKPWILSSSVDPTNIYAHLEECYTIWSSSGLEEALQSIADTIDFEYHSTVNALQESIKYTCNLDELALGSQVSVCRLSRLPSAAVPEMKLVFWNGDYYFLTLANLWANLISCDPPELPHLDVCS